MCLKVSALAGLASVLVIATSTRELRAEGGHHEELHHVSGLKGIGALQLEEGESHFGEGGGLFVERVLVRHWLDGELSVAALALEGELALPVDVIVKHPFEVSESLTLYMGGGASLTYEKVDGAYEWLPGVAAQSGLYYWVSEHYGVDVELDYNFFLTEEGGHELTGAVGPVMRF